MAHWLTNRGKLLLAQGEWDDGGATIINVGLITGAAVPTTMDTEAEIQDLNFVNDLLVLVGVDEPVGGWYTRNQLTRTNAAEDDANNWVAMDAANVTWTAATAGENIIAGFVFKELGADTVDELISVFTFASALPTNGSDITLTITDLYRLT